MTPLNQKCGYKYCKNPAIYIYQTKVRRYYCELHHKILAERRTPLKIKIIERRQK